MSFVPRLFLRYRGLSNRCVTKNGMRGCSIRHRSSGPANKVRDWLVGKGYDAKTAEGILAAFPSKNPTLGELKSIGDEGLSSLGAAVKQKLGVGDAQNTKQTVKVHISIPHHDTAFDLETEAGNTFYDMSLEHGELLSEYMECACGGIAACSTCHVIVDAEQFGLLPEAEEDELDVLDLAYGVTERSRLGCRISITKELDGLKVELPNGVNNLYA